MIVGQQADLILHIGIIGFIFNTTITDRNQTTSVPIIWEEDIVTLPKGQAFVLVNGGEIYKLRIPLPISHH